jgi:tetratricopeptide (TPR) repeat protein
MKDFFISYNQADRAWAEWIAWTLEQAGWTTVIQAWDFVGNWVLQMDRSMRETQRTIAVLSPSYLGALYTFPEWADAFRRDPKGERDLLIPVKVDPVQELEGILAQVAYTDLVGRSEAEARATLLARVEGRRGKPDLPPRYPGPQPGVSTPGKALFPGSGPSLPPRPRRFFGRDAVLDAVVDAILAEDPLPIPVLGPAGIGKSTLTRAALHDRRVAARFGRRRWFVSLDGAQSGEAVIAASAAVLGLEPGANLRARIVAELARAPGLLVLDNAETPLWVDGPGTESWLSEIGAVPGLAVLVSIRGAARPPGLDWHEPFHLKPLDRQTSRTLFLVTAGSRLAEDPLLERLLDALGDVPLAILLMAHVAETEPDLEGVWRRWRDEKTSMLAHGGRTDREANLAASLELSIRSPLMTIEGRRLLALLGRLPDGIAHGDLETVLPDVAARAAGALRRLDLVFDSDRRLRMLAPVREHVAAAHPADREDERRAVAFYCSLATRLGPRVGAEGGAEAAARLASEAGNVEAMLLAGAQGAMLGEAIPAAVAFAQFQRNAGLGSTAPLLRAAEEAERAGDRLGRASCLAAIGDITLARSDPEGARRCYEQALSLYQGGGSAIGQANCIQSLGDIALRLSAYEEAQDRFTAAMSLYERAGDLLGQANCVRSLGNIAFARSDHEEARRRYEQALSMHEAVGDLLGQGSCVRSLGNIALERSDHETARRRFEQALTIYRKSGSLLGRANGVRSLGDIALRCSDHVAGRQRYEEALPLYERLGDLFGQASCVRSLGDIALERGEHEEAQQRYQQALPMCAKVGDLIGQANCIRSLGDIALARADPEGARELYLQALSIYERVGSLLGQANCIKAVGDIARRRSEPEAARQHYDRALPIYEKVGDLLGQANCIGSFGDLARAAGRDEEARARYEEALRLYRRIPEPYSVGRALEQLARVARDDDERRRCCNAAREAWFSIGRPDLVAELDADFPP